MKFLALVLAAAAVCAQEFEFPLGPEPDFSHSELLEEPVVLTASAGRRAVQSFSPSSPDGIWMRLIFGEVELPQDAVITVRSVFDGDEQQLDTDSLKDWAFHTAFMNGDELEVSVDSKSEASVAVVGMIVGENPPAAYRNETGSKRTLCHSSDTRQRAQSRRKDARFMLGGGYCSAWLINDQHGCFLSAGHCNPNNNAVFQFNVPDSTNSGGVQNPSSQYQFPINTASNQGVNGGAGNDWRYVGANRNSNNQSPRQLMGNGYVLSTATNTPSTGSTWQLYGHGSATGRMNLVLKGSRGSFSGRSSNRVQYRVDSTGGDSGSAVTYPGSGGDADGTAVAIHTHGGCTANGGANSGTWIRHPNLQSALNSPRGVCQTGF